ncbi:MAG: hypothetical protein RMK15_06565, partial [Chloroflexota bacterium]|nr:hypothetical protein [Dehalococcoidia bacterium]MDW8046926.1 hypothetical protein [Chloroflexota bacterium]
LSDQRVRMGYSAAYLVLSAALLAVHWRDAVPTARTAWDLLRLRTAEEADGLPEPAAPARHDVAGR